MATETTDNAPLGPDGPAVKNKTSWRVVEAGVDSATAHIRPWDPEVGDWMPRRGPADGGWCTPEWGPSIVEIMRIRGVREVVTPAAMAAYIIVAASSAAELADSVEHVKASLEAMFARRKEGHEKRLAREALRATQSQRWDGERAALEAAAPVELTPESDDNDVILYHLARMDVRHAYVLRKRRGLAGAAASTLEEIGNDLGLSKERVRQIEEAASRKLEASIRRGLRLADEDRHANRR